MSREWQQLKKAISCGKPRNTVTYCSNTSSKDLSLFLSVTSGLDPDTGSCRQGWNPTGSGSVALVSTVQYKVKGTYSSYDRAIILLKIFKIWMYYKVYKMYNFVFYWFKIIRSVYSGGVYIMYCTLVRKILPKIQTLRIFQESAT